VTGAARSQGRSLSKPKRLINAEKQAAGLSHARTEKPCEAEHLARSDFED
jgi:hypothetical protein